MAASAQPATICSNRNARRDYQITETVEAGIALRGTEVKSIRAGKANIADAFARFDGGRAVLHQCDIQAYEKGNVHNHEPRRERALLLHKDQIDRFAGQTKVKGRTVVALEMYWKSGKVKLLLGLGTGKTHGDRRQDIKRAEAKREMDRAIKNRLR